MSLRHFAGHQGVIPIKAHENSCPGRTAAVFRDLARDILENESRVIPIPVNDLAELEQMYRQHMVKK